MVEVFAKLQSISSSPRVPAQRQPIIEELIGYVELVILGIPTCALKIFELNAQDHVLGFGEQVDFIIAKPELASSVTKALLVVSPGAVEAHAAIDATLQDSPPATEFLHVTVHCKAAISGVRGHRVHPIFSLPQCADV